MFILTMAESRREEAISVETEKMSVDPEDDEGEDIMKSILEGAQAISLTLLPEKSAEKYLREYDIFSTWRDTKKIPGKNSSEAVMLVYFNELQPKYKPNTMWVKYSMLRTTILRNENTDIVYPKLIAYLKKNSDGYKPKKSKTLEAEHVARFLGEADDREFLFTKVVLTFGTFGATRAHELVKLTVDDVIEKGNIFLVQIMETKTKVDRSFTVQNEYAEYVRRYKALRKPGTPHNRFFVNYQKGKCTVQPVGKNKFYDIPRNVATFLGLQNPAIYTGHCFRRTSSTVFVNGGGDITMLKRLGGWKSNSVAEGYIDDSMASKMKINQIIASEIKKRSSGSSTITSASTSSVQREAEASGSRVFTQSVQYSQTNVNVSSVGGEKGLQALPNDRRSMQFENLKNCTFNFYLNE